jgi:hypothetical protein
MIRILPFFSLASKKGTDTGAVIIANTKKIIRIMKLENMDT